ncbi:MAG: DNA mismatch repair protein MutS [Myxococcales bacterium]|nr:DNA mismatch repair protein MutS [Myxococcales bacterium]
MKAKSALDTPMMRQFLAIKAQQPDAIVFYRMGDFYEMFLHDAEVAAPLLDIALTTRDRGKQDAVPMCGIPVHSAEPHIKKLAELGYRVAICEQVEDPIDAGGKRLVKRAVVEVVTPGLSGDPTGIESNRELALVALLPTDAGVGLAVLDASTGDFRATHLERPRTADGAKPPVLPGALPEELLRIDPREVLLPEPMDPSLDGMLATLLPGAARTAVDSTTFATPAVHELGGPTAAIAETAVRAAGAVLGYLRANQPFALSHISRLRAYQLSDAMVLDSATCDHLELFRNSEDGSRSRTLVERLDRTVTPLGARRLTRWLAYPLLDVAAIRSRQDAVEYLADRDRPRARLRDLLRPVRDLERLLTKAARPTSTPRDMAALRASLEALPEVAVALDRADDERLSGTEGARPAALRLPTPVPEVAVLLREAIVEDAPVVARGSRGALETGYIRAGFHAELDALRNGVGKGRETIAGLEARERDRSGISTLKVRFHPVHGYSFEVTKTNLARVPDDYERKQTLANVERFTTRELREIEQTVLFGNANAARLERELFEQIRASVVEFAPRIREAADATADVDALATFAEVARLSGWVRPEVYDGEALDIRAGRHPVVEGLLVEEGGEFVPNDAELDPGGAQLVVLTGPNMSGKSTYLRQVALIVLLAQIGSFVPAESARVGVVDRVFTRVGASDRLARGESTFMVEMRETADILAHASRRSLVILDEIGRGTSTFDGLSIAWAVAEYLHDTPGLAPRTLFATHYHELSDLVRTKARVRNAHFQAREWGEEVVFLRQLVSGGANRSYGIQVARLAGLPAIVIDRAREILGNLEGGELDERGRPRLAEPSPNIGSGSPAAAAQAGVHGRSSRPEPGAPDSQLGLFSSPDRPPEEDEVLDELRKLDPDRTTPLDALQTLTDLVARLRGGPR